jgi:hypothetical protein
VAWIDYSIPYDKRDKATHRFTIADTRGPLALTVPIVKPDYSRAPSWDDVMISTHGEWWNKHLTSLESAYGRTPFFEFYIDRLRPFFSRETAQNFGTVTRLSRAANSAVCQILGLPEPSAASPSATMEINDLVGAPLEGPSVEYHQIRADSLGWIPGMSVLDLIFNMGPESPLILKKIIDAI